MTTLIPLALLAATASSLNATPLLALGAVALAVRAVEAVRAIQAAGPGERGGVVGNETSRAMTPAPPAYPGEQVVAVIYPYRGRLRLRRRRA